MRKPLTDTVAALRLRYDAVRDWRAVAEELGYTESGVFATLNAVALAKEGSISAEREVELRQRLGLSPRLSPSRTRIDITNLTPAQQQHIERLVKHFRTVNK